MLDSIVEQNRNRLIQSTQELLQINSVATESTDPNQPFGAGPAKALAYMLQLGQSLGFTVKNVDGYAGHIEYGEGDEYVAVLAHLDVVPVGSGWTYPPFGAEIHDGKIFARGAIDDKGPAMSILYALQALKESGRPIGRKIRLIYGLDEETDWRCMEHYFQKEPKPWGGFTPDADFPMINAEKGILNVELKRKRLNNVQPYSLLTLQGGERSNMVPDTCQAMLKVASTESQSFRQKIEQLAHDLNIPFLLAHLEGEMWELTVHGVSAHGSLPELGVNAVVQMMKILAQLSLSEAVVVQFLSQLDTQGTRLGVECSDNVTGALTSNLGVCKVDEEWNCVINIRYPVDRTADQLIASIRETIGTEWEVILSHDMRPLYVPADSPVVEALSKVYQEQTGEEARLLAIGGGTYARAIPNGVAFGACFPGMEELAHQKNEYIAIDHVIRMTKIYAHAIYALSHTE